MRDQIVAQLQQQANPRAAEGMARFGIRGVQVLGVSIPTLRKMAKATGKNHALALELWATGIHEVRILASMIDEPQLVSWQQMEAWVGEFDSWDICATRCGNLFVNRPYAYEKVMHDVSVRKNSRRLL